MLFFLVLIQLFFAAVFFVFDRFLESGFFLLLAFLSLVYFFFVSGESKPSTKKSSGKIYTTFLSWTKKISPKISYYSSSISFYIGGGLLFYSVSVFLQIPSISLGLLLFVIGGVLLALLFVFYKKQVEQLLFLLRTHSLLLVFYSLVYIAQYYIFQIPTPDFVLLNGFLGVATMFFLALFDGYVSSFFQRIMYVVFLVALSIISWFSFSLYFSLDIYLQMIIQGAIFGSLFYWLVPYVFAFFQKKPSIKVCDLYSKMYAIIHTLVAQLIITFVLFKGLYSSIFLFVLLFLLLVFHIRIHVLFTNFIVFTLSITTTLFLYMYFLQDWTIASDVFLLLFVFIYPLVSVGITHLISFENIEVYIIHYIGFIFMVISTVVFLVQGSLSILGLDFALLLIAEAVLWYLSYKQTRKFIPHYE